MVAWDERSFARPVIAYRESISLSLEIFSAADEVEETVESERRRRNREMDRAFVITRVPSARISSACPRTRSERTIDSIDRYRAFRFGDDGEAKEWLLLRSAKRFKLHPWWNSCTLISRSNGFSCKFRYIYPSFDGKLTACLSYLVIFLLYLRHKKFVTMRKIPPKTYRNRYLCSRLGTRNCLEANSVYVFVHKA